MEKSQSRIAVNEARGQFGNQKESGNPLLETVTIRLAKTVID
jgi:hypothetical protein